MEPYRIDFAMMRGHELILDREQPITREELDTMELQMLRGNEIPFLLPVEWIEIDGTVTFRYAIEGRKMLTHQLQLQQLTMQDFYTCLLAVADALDACKSYLLRPECCLLQDSCLFIGERWDDVSLLYVPIVKPAEEHKKAVEGAGTFSALVMRLAAHVTNLDGSGLQLLLRQLQDRHGVRPAIRKVLLELIRSDNADSGIGHSTNPQQQTSMDHMEELHMHVQHEVRAPYVQSLSQFQARPNAVHERSDPSQANSDLLPLSNFDDHEQQQAPQRARWTASAMAVIAAAIVWRFGYAGHPSSGRLLICLGVTALITAIAYLAGWRSKDGRNNHKHDLAMPDNHRPHTEHSDPSMHWLVDSQVLERRAAASRPAHKEIAAAQPLIHSFINPEAKKSNAMNSHIETLYDTDTANNPNGGQGADAASDATVWMGNKRNHPLSSDSAIQADRSLTWQLERTAKGVSEQLALSGEGAPFLIGRYSDKVHYADEHPGISRVHLELGNDEEGVTVKDLGSRNGTTLNGNPMIAYKQYKLQNEDALQLAGNDGPIYTIRQVMATVGG